MMYYVFGRSFSSGKDIDLKDASRNIFTHKGKVRNIWISFHMKRKNNLEKGKEIYDNAAKF